MNKDISDLLVNAVEKNRDLILESNEYLWKNPETGFKEWKANEYLIRKYKALGYELKEAGDIPGFVATFDSGKPGPTILVFGELDALGCKSHPESDQETGAVHACGHCSQTAALIGIAAALKEKGVADNICGKIMLCAVPAEELIEVSFREELQKKGTIKYFGGKTEFLRRGLLDGAQLALMVHTSTEKSGVLSVQAGCNGCIAKIWTFRGKATHAAVPQQCVNALYAVNTTLTACNAIRETFADELYMRFHPVITKSSSTVNVISDFIELESYVRGADMKAIVEANNKFNRAAAACAASIGAQVHIKDKPGYYVRKDNPKLAEVFKEACDNDVAEYKEIPEWDKCCTDMGDIGAVMPIIHPAIGGATGTPHGIDYRISDPESTCVTSAKIQLKALCILLEESAEVANSIIREAKPDFSNKEDYFKFLEKITLDQDAVIYNPNGGVSLSFSK